MDSDTTHKRESLFTNADREALAAFLKGAFGPDVTWANHPDPMTDEDWLSMADHALRLLIGPN